MTLKSGDTWKTEKNVVYKTSKTGNNIFKYDWKVMQFVIGDIRETDLKDFKMVSIKLIYTTPPSNTSSSEPIFSLSTEPCTAIYDRKHKMFEFIEKPRGNNNPMGYSNARIVGSSLLLEYVENTGYVYATKLKKVENTVSN